MNKRQRKERGPVTVACQLCDWKATGPTWRPVKRLAATHRDEKHG